MRLYFSLRLVEFDEQRFFCLTLIEYLILFCIIGDSVKQLVISS